jgi:hypothetical protein
MCIFLGIFSENYDDKRIIIDYFYSTGLKFSQNHEKAWKIFQRDPFIIFLLRFGIF